MEFRVSQAGYHGDHLFAFLSDPVENEVGMQRRTKREERQEYDLKPDPIDKNCLEPCFYPPGIEERIGGNHRREYKQVKAGKGM